MKITITSALSNLRFRQSMAMCPPESETSPGDWGSSQAEKAQRGDLLFVFKPFIHPEELDDGIELDGIAFVFREDAGYAMSYYMDEKTFEMGFLEGVLSAKATEATDAGQYFAYCAAHLTRQADEEAMKRLSNMHKWPGSGQRDNVKDGLPDPLYFYLTTLSVAVDPTLARSPIPIVELVTSLVSPNTLPAFSKSPKLSEFMTLYVKQAGAKGAEPAPAPSASEAQSFSLRDLFSDGSPAAPAPEPPKPAAPNSLRDLFSDEPVAKPAPAPQSNSLRDLFSDGAAPAAPAAPEPAKAAVNPIRDLFAPTSKPAPPAQSLPPVQKTLSLESLFADDSSPIRPAEQSKPTRSGGLFSGGGLFASPPEDDTSSINKLFSSDPEPQAPPAASAPVQPQVSAPVPVPSPAPIHAPAMAQAAQISEAPDRMTKVDAILAQLDSPGPQAPPQPVPTTLDQILAGTNPSATKAPPNGGSSLDSILAGLSGNSAPAAPPVPAPTPADPAGKIDPRKRFRDHSVFTEGDTDGMDDLIPMRSSRSVAIPQAPQKADAAGVNGFLSDLQRELSTSNAPESTAKSGTAHLDASTLNDFLADLKQEVTLPGLTGAPAQPAAQPEPEPEPVAEAPQPKSNLDASTLNDFLSELREEVSLANLAAEAAANPAPQGVPGQNAESPRPNAMAARQAYNDLDFESLITAAQQPADEAEQEAAAVPPPEPVAHFAAEGPPRAPLTLESLFSTPEQDEEQQTHSAEESLLQPEAVYSVQQSPEPGAEANSDMEQQTTDALQGEARVEESNSNEVREREEAPATADEANYLQHAQPAQDSAFDEQPGNASSSESEEEQEEESARYKPGAILFEEETSGSSEHAIPSVEPAQSAESYDEQEDQSSVTAEQVAQPAAEEMPQAGEQEPVADEVSAQSYDQVATPETSGEAEADLREPYAEPVQDASTQEESGDREPVAQSDDSNIQPEQHYSDWIPEAEPAVSEAVEHEPAQQADEATSTSAGDVNSVEHNGEVSLQSRETEDDRSGESLQNAEEEHAESAPEESLPEPINDAEPADGQNRQEDFHLTESLDSDTDSHRHHERMESEEEAEVTTPEETPADRGFVEPEQIDSSEQNTESEVAEPVDTAGEQDSSATGDSPESELQSQTATEDSADESQVEPTIQEQEQELNALEAPGEIAHDDQRPSTEPADRQEAQHGGTEYESEQPEVTNDGEVPAENCNDQVVTAVDHQSAPESSAPSSHEDEKHGNSEVASVEQDQLEPSPASPGQEQSRAESLSARTPDHSTESPRSSQPEPPAASSPGETDTFEELSFKRLKSMSLNELLLKLEEQSRTARQRLNDILLTQQNEFERDAVLLCDDPTTTEVDLGSELKKRRDQLLDRLKETAQTGSASLRGKTAEAKENIQEQFTRGLAELHELATANREASLITDLQEAVASLEALLDERLQGLLSEQSDMLKRVSSEELQKFSTWADMRIPQMESALRGEIHDISAHSRAWLQHHTETTTAKLRLLYESELNRLVITRGQLAEELHHSINSAEIKIRESSEQVFATAILPAVARVRILLNQHARELRMETVKKLSKEIENTVTEFEPTLALGREAVTLIERNGLDLREQVHNEQRQLLEEQSTVVSQWFESKLAQLKSELSAETLGGSTDGRDERQARLERLVEEVKETAGTESTNSKSTFRESIESAFAELERKSTEVANKHTSEIASSVGTWQQRSEECIKNTNNRLEDLRKKIQNLHSQLIK